MSNALGFAVAAGQISKGARRRAVVNPLWVSKAADRHIALSHAGPMNNSSRWRSCGLLRSLHRRGVRPRTQSCPKSDADIARDFPAAAVLLIAELVGRDRSEQIGGRIADLAGRRHDLQPFA